MTYSIHDVWWTLTVTQWQAGMPPKVLEYDIQLAEAAYNLANTWHTADVMGIGGAKPKTASPNQLEGWSAEQVSAEQGSAL